MNLLDSNIWVFLLDAELPEHGAVNRRVYPVLKSHEVVMPAVVQLEVVHYLARQLKTEAKSIIDGFLSFPATSVPLDADAVHRAAAILGEHRDAGIGARDATLLDVAKRHGALLITHDAALFEVARRRGQQVWDPIREQRRPRRRPI